MPSSPEGNPHISEQEMTADSGTPGEHNPVDDLKGMPRHLEREPRDRRGQYGTAYTSKEYYDHRFKEDHARNGELSKAFREGDPNVTEAEVDKSAYDRLESLDKKEKFGFAVKAALWDSHESKMRHAEAYEEQAILDAVAEGHEITYGGQVYKPKTEAETTEEE